MNSTLMPTRPGQICKIVSAVPDMESEDVFIVTQDPAEFGSGDDILVVSIKDLQRNLNSPDNVKRTSVRKEELVFIAEDLTAYINSWNKR